MNLNISQNNYNVIKQSIRNTRIKINLLNYQFQVVDEISGNVIEGNLSIDANSDIRRCVDISIIVDDSSFEIQAGGKIYLDKYIQIYTGIDSLFTGETIWANRGIYLINSPTWNYSSETNTLSFQGLDLMSKLTGIRNGYLEGIPTIIPQNSSVRDSMIATITQLGGFKNYIVSECKNKDGNIQSVPYDIKLDQGSTVFDIIKQLRDILPNYETFFDINGTFVYQQIPSGVNDVVLIDDDIWHDVLLSESVFTDFENVKNIIEVYGKSLSPAYFNISTVSGSNYVVEYSGVTSLVDNLLYGFTAPSIIINPYLKINELTAYPIVNEDGSVAIIPEANNYYIVKWQASKNNFLFMGYQQPYAIAKDENPDSPFYINGAIGPIRLPLYGGEYDNIYTNDLCKQRAEYELWQHTQLQQKLNISCVSIDWLDVNILANYSQKNSFFQEKYIIKKITTNLGVDGIQSIEMIKFYPLYPI